MPKRRSVEEESGRDPSTSVGYDPTKHESHQYGTGAVPNFKGMTSRNNLRRFLEKEEAKKKDDVRFEARSWRFWKPGPILDQGSLPQCTGYSWRQFLATGPNARTDSNPTPAEIYQNAQKLDEYPGETDGAGIVGGAKWLRQRNIIKSWAWTSSAEDMKNYVINNGCIEVSTWFHNNMVKIDNGGYARPTGGQYGYHAYLVTGYSARRNAFRCVNSWGPNWGRRGRFWIKFSDMQILMNDQGKGITAPKA